MAQNYKNQLPQITTLIFDVDGVFTNGIVYLHSDGSQVRTANVKDGYALQYAVKMGYRIAIITGGNNEMVKKRFEGLGVKDIFLSSHDKLSVFNKYLQDHGVDASEVLYMGDDIPDIKVLEKVGIGTCPADAAPEVQEVCNYVSHKAGGEGCIRDVLEQVMRVQGKWMTDEAHQW